MDRERESDRGRPFVPSKPFHARYFSTCSGPAQTFLGCFGPFHRVKMNFKQTHIICLYMLAHFRYNMQTSIA